MNLYPIEHHAVERIQRYRHEAEAARRASTAAAGRPTLVRALRALGHRLMTYAERLEPSEDRRAGPDRVGGPERRRGPDRRAPPARHHDPRHTARVPGARGSSDAGRSRAWDDGRRGRRDEAR